MPMLPVFSLTRAQREAPLGEVLNLGKTIPDSPLGISPD
jgi:hypothetical protein